MVEFLGLLLDATDEEGVHNLGSVSRVIGFDRFLEGRASSSMGRYGITNPRYFLKYLS